MTTQYDKNDDLTINVLATKYVDSIITKKERDGEWKTILKQPMFLSLG